MKLHTDNTNRLILSSDDIVASGKNVGKKLTEIIDNHTTDINELKQYTKWLYKYGGTGSKGGSGGSGSSSSYSLQYQIRLAGIQVKNGDNIILGDKIENEKSVPLEIILTNPKGGNNKYTISDLVVNEKNQSITGRTSFTIENNFKQSYSLSLAGKNKGKISFFLIYQDDNDYFQQASVSFFYIKNAYSFNIDIVNNQNKTLFMNNDSIFYTNVFNIESGVNLKIDYDLQVENDVIVNTQLEGILSESEFIINSIDRKEGTFIISFNKDFITGEDIIGDYSLPLSFYSNNVRIYQTILNFTIVPADDVYIKIIPVLPNAQIYKYKYQNNEDYNISLISEFNTYSKYYELYNKLNINNVLDENEITDIISYFHIDRNQLSELNFYQDLKYILYNELNNYKYYVFSTGNIGFKLSPYMPHNISETILYYQIGKLDTSTHTIEWDDPIDQGYIKSTNKNKIFNINIVNAGIYILNVYTQDTHNRISYYLYTYEKDNTFNWYRSNILNIFDNNPSYLHYFRNGNVTSAFEKYKNNQYIQQFASGDDITPFNIPLTFSTDLVYDCFVSIGIQYSSINNANSYKNNDGHSIITINSIDSNLKLEIYQDKILLGENKITLFLPKEEDYNINNNSNYHLLSIYKRYIYYNDNPYYEICVYLDGILEGAAPAFINSKNGWNSIVLHNSNYGINLLEVAYLPHTDNYYEDSSGNIVYLDDIAISEYHYKYANECNSFANNISATSEILNALRNFKETEYGMIEVENEDTIKDISKSINIPVMVLEYNEGSTDTSTSQAKPKFVSNFFYATEQEDPEKKKWILNGLYYSPGKYELDLSKDDCKIFIDDNAGDWYIQTQGSSTMQYFVKNLTLGITPKQSGYICLYTPNFIYSEDTADNVEEAVKSYLPEKSFTLKADMVDSSHSNNTSIGDFVNNNTKKFEINFNEHSVYHKYIKNCLTGYPILVFIKINSYDSSSAQVSNIYFLGIYNFNLGRDSYFNMGYYDPKLLQTNNDGYIHNKLKTCDGTKFVTMKFQLENADHTDLLTSDGVIVAEIQGNSNYYDFSQYDKSILIPFSDINDDGAMFGDFVPELNTNSQNKILWHLRRLVEHVSKGGGYIFEHVLHKHLGMHSYAYSRYIEDGVNSSIFNSANQVPTYRLQFYRRIEGSNDQQNRQNKYLINTNDTNIINNLITTNNNDYWANLMTYLKELIFSSDVAGSGAIKEPILDYPSLAEYYTICMAFGMTDSVMKNLNIKTWDATWLGDNGYGTEYNREIEDVQGASLRGKWFVAFYDMDTAFGRFNNGTSMENAYFSFSDYWVSNEYEAKEITVYKDFYPRTNSLDPYVSSQQTKIDGYDYPSSYLFAIAKYAAIAFEDAGVKQPDGSILNTLSQNDYFKMYVPQNIWTKFRALPSYVTSESPYFGLHGIGELQNAKYFVNKYFSKKLNNIPEQLWNMNYRFKYLKHIKSDPTSYYGYSQITDQNSGFSAKEYASFHGRGINQVEDWLNYRFHILDAYFNVDDSSSNITYLDYTNNYTDKDTYELVTVNDNNDEFIGYTWNDTSSFIKNTMNKPMWKPTDYWDITPVGAYDLLRMNPDVVILRDVFSNNEQGNRYGNLYLRIRAMEYSPVLIVPYSRIFQQKYLLIDPKTWYTFEVQQAGTDNIKLGGSALWTHIENANSLIAGGALVIKSDKIQDVIITRGNCESWNIGSMKSLSLLSIRRAANDNDSRFTGEISIDSSNYDYHPNLTTIILERTEMSLSISKSGSIRNIEYIYSKGSLTLFSCNNLTNVKLTGSILTNCVITPGWSNNINISNVNIQNLSIAPKDNADPNNTLIINEIPTLKTLNIEGIFKTIIIKKCKSLNNIFIRNPESIESLQIIECNTILDQDTLYPQLEIRVMKDNSEISISSKDLDLENKLENKLLNLNTFTNLKEISFNGTQGFNIIDIQELNGYEYTFDIDNGGNTYKVIRLIGPAFQYTQLRRIDSADDLYLLIDVNSNQTEQTATFRNSYIGEATIPKYSIKNNFIVSKNVTNLSYLFANEYTFGENKRTGGILTDDAAAILGNMNNASFKFIYENINNIQNMSNMFSGQSISCQSRTDSIKLSLSLFKYVNNISGIFSSCTGFTYLSQRLFKKDEANVLGLESPTLKIDTFATNIDKIEVNSFTPIINKIIGLTFNGYNSLTINKVFDENGNDLINDDGINIGELLFDGIDENNNITEISGISISESLKINWKNLFIIIKNNENYPKLPNLMSIDNAFNHKENNENVDKIGLKYLTKKQDKKQDISLFNALNINNESCPIDYSDIHELNKLTKKIIVSDNSLSLYKTINEENLKTYLIEYNSNEYKIKNLNYIFSNVILQLNDASDNYELILDKNANTSYDFTSMSHAFENFKVKNKTGIPIPFYISQRTLRSFNKVTMWDSAFAKVTLYKNLPLNMFNQLINNDLAPNKKYLASNYNHIINSMNNMFSNVRITNESWFAHEDYNDICDSNGSIKTIKSDYNSPLEGSYHQVITTNYLGTNLSNPISVDCREEGTNKIYGENIVNHLVLPFDIFFACTAQCNIDGCFADSDFEGIMPDKIINDSAVNNSNNRFISTFKNLLIIPNKVYITDSHTNQLRNYGYRLLDGDGKSLNESLNYNKPIELPTYVFVPSSFASKISDYEQAFNFKIILPNSIRSNGSSNQQEVYFIFKYDSLNLSNSGTNLFKSMPGTEQVGFMENLFNQKLNGSGDIVNTFDNTQYHNILYGMMLPDTSKIEITYNETQVNKEESYGLDRADFGFEYNDALQMAFDTYGNIFTDKLVTLLYGYIVNEYDGNQNTFKNFFINNKLSVLSSGEIRKSFINISASPIMINNITVNKYCVGKFTVLPNISCMENDKKYMYTISGLGKHNSNPNLTLLNTDNNETSLTSYKFIMSQE